MKIKNLTIIALIFAFIFVSTSLIFAQGEPGGGKRAPKGDKKVQRENHLYKNLNLTGEQTKKADEIFKASKEKSEKVFTAEQKEEMKTMRENARQERQERKEKREKMKKHEPKYPLTEEQKASLKNIRESSMKEFKSILTKEQLDKFEKGHERNMRKRHDGPGGEPLKCENCGSEVKPPKGPRGEKTDNTKK